MGKHLISAMIAAMTLVSVEAFCQANVNTDMNITSQATSDNDVLRVTNSYTGTAQDRVGIRSTSVQQPGWGIGAELNGGWCGLYCNATTSGGNSGRQAGYFNATGGGTGSHYGIQAYAHDVSGPKYGVKGGAYGGTGPNYGVFGTAPDSLSAYGVYCRGDFAYTDQQIKVSDARLKKNIIPMNRSIDKLMQLHPITYEYDRESYPRMGFSRGKRYGLTAQDIEKVFPELVSDNVCPVDDPTTEIAAGIDGSIKNPSPKLVQYKGVDFIDMIPILVKVIQEQQAEIEAMKAKVAGLKY